MNKLLLAAFALGCCTSALVYAQDNSVAAVEARAKSSPNAGPIEVLTPNIIRARIQATQQAAVAGGRRPDPALIPPGQPMSMEEIRAYVAKQYEKSNGR